MTPDDETCKAHSGCMATLEDHERNISALWGKYDEMNKSMHEQVRSVDRKTIAALVLLVGNLLTLIVFLIRT